jgi:hypothetical protein
MEVSSIALCQAQSDLRQYEKRLESEVAAGE